MVPLFDETLAFQFSNYYFKRLGITPYYCFDEQGAIETAELVKASGHPLRSFKNDRPCIENGYQAFVEQSPTDWILRIDCDEVPSSGLLEWCAEYCKSGNVGAVRFERDQIAWRGSRLWISTHPNFIPARNGALRLFHRGKVEYTTEIHTPGILTDQEVSAPLEHRLYHLSWVFRTAEDLKKKSERYDLLGQKLINQVRASYPPDRGPFREFSDRWLTSVFRGWVLEEEPQLSESRPSPPAPAVPTSQVRANFFWYGFPLSLYNMACLTSFVRQGFEVMLHSFDRTVKVPEGVTVVDARALGDPDEIWNRVQGGQKGSLASFSNIFRYRLLARSPGWWFDTDLVCLVPATAFADLAKTCPGITVGWESEGRLNGAVMGITDPEIARDLERMAVEKGGVVPWGSIGPGLITEYLDAHRERFQILDRRAFYPLSYTEVDRFFDPDQANACEEAARNSLCLHLWNEIITRMDIPKDILPPQGSFLGDVLAQFLPDQGNQPRLPISFFDDRRGRARAESLVAELSRTVEALNAQIDGMRRSTSWRFTSPFRRITSRMQHYLSKLARRSR